MKKKGISLITLVITIVVVIVLAAAVVLAISNNNPINSAKVATVTQMRDNLNSAISVYLSNVHGKTLGEYSTSQILFGNNENTFKYKIVDNDYCYIKENGEYKELHKLTKASIEGKLNIDLKEIDNKSSWYIDNLGKAYLIYDTKEDISGNLKENGEVLQTVSGIVLVKLDESEVPLGTRAQASISFENANVNKEVGSVSFTNNLTNTGDGVVVYTSSDETVATINENGMVSILTTGETIITATVEDTRNYIYDIKSISYKLTVSQTTSITGMTGGDLEVSATVTTDSNNTDFTNSKYVFTTSNTPLGTTDTTIYSDGTISSATYTAKAAKVAGTYYLHVLVASTNGTLKEVISSSTAVCQGVKDFAYTGSAQNMTLPKGNYKLEVWGAEGGSGNAYKSSLLGGKGGYSKGNLTLTTNTDIYVYVGGKGNVKNAVDEIVDGGYNGGGNNACTSVFSVGSGGGGTDIRLGSTTVFARIIVAGGGGGSTGRNDNKYGGSGGNGGGTTGTRATDHINSKYQSGYPGTQSSGGSGYTQNANGADAVSSGEFFQGANKAAEKNVSGGRWRRLVWWRLRILCWISRWLRLGIYH